MNFFESQDAARRNTGRLMLLFALAVMSLILLTNLLVMLAFGLFNTDEAATGLVFNWSVFLAVSLGVGCVVLFGSLYKILSLRGGGARVAEMMNARLLLPDSSGLEERRLLNIVEEMAIASGTPVPPVYVMEEAGINAFAAGYSPGDAVIGVTRGAMQQLNREQLQGIIAHEFSHILHGDMRINIRLIGVLHGILVLGIIGYYLLRSGSRTRRSKDAAGIAILGLGLVVIGYTGTFFGNLIKAAVSRQREYLADASAVQFTRNPEGIAGALMQIGSNSSHSYLEHPGSQEINHALFEEAKRLSFRGLYATHPPLDDRIRAILPNWDGDYTAVNGVKPLEATPIETQSQGTSEGGSEVRTDMLGILTGGVLATIGDPSATHLATATRVLASIPEPVLSAAREPCAARALVYYLSLDDDPQLRRAQCMQLAESADDGVYSELERLQAQQWEVGQEQRLPLAEIALPALRQLSANQYRLFKSNFQALIAQDDKVKLFEWCLHKYVFHHLDQVYMETGSPGFGRRNLLSCGSSIAVLLGVISSSQKSRTLTAEQVFLKGCSELDLDLAMPPLDRLNYAALDAALVELSSVRPLQKPALLKACAASIEADREVTPLEADLLRTVAAIVDCPMPPLLPTQT